MNHPPHDPRLPAQLPSSLRPEVLPAVHGAARPAALSANPDVLGLLKALRRRWGLALVLGVVLAGLLGAATYLVVPRAKYTATATMHVATKPKRIIFDPQERETDFRTYQKTQTALLKNRRVLAHALAKPEVAGLSTVREQVDPEEWLEQSLKVEFPGGSEVLQVTLSGDRAEDLAKIVNAVVKSYMTVIVEEEYRERVARLDALRKLREKYESDLKLKRKSLRETVAAVGVTDQAALSVSQQYKAEHLGLAQRELMHARSEILKSQAELSVVEGTVPQAQARPGERPAAAAPAPEPPSVDDDPRIQELAEKLDEIAGQYKNMKVTIKQPSDPILLRLKRQYQDTSDRLERLRRSLASAPAGASPANPAGPAAASDGPSGLVDARSRLAVWKAYSDSLTKDVAQLQGELKDTNEKGLDLENEREEISIATGVSRKVGAEVEAVQVELGAPERIRPLAEAKIPNKKDELRQLKAGGGAALGAFCFALLSVSYWEFRARRVDAVDEVMHGLGMRIVGTLPAMPRKLRSPGSGGSALAVRWQNRLVESVDAMRAVLLHASRSDATRVVMVTSAVKGEGKTSLACHLATSLARAGRKTLLIDCDLRSPACHRLFDLPAAPGLCDLLRGEATADELISDGGDFSPSVLPAGQVDPLAVQALAQDEFRHQLAALRSRYDFIVVDSAPVLPVADSLLVGQSVDAVIFSVMREVSRLPMVYTAYERLAALGVRILGAVVTGVQDAAHDYEYRSREAV